MGALGALAGLFSWASSRSKDDDTKGTAEAAPKTLGELAAKLREETLVVAAGIIVGAGRREQEQREGEGREQGAGQAKHRRSLSSAPL